MSANDCLWTLGLSMADAKHPKYNPSYPFKCQSPKMVKHIQTIRRQFADKLLECVWPFWGVGAYRVKNMSENV